MQFVYCVMCDQFNDATPRLLSIHTTEESANHARANQTWMLPEHYHVWRVAVNQDNPYLPE
jgi:hypothetical protein